jgi:DNA ligase-1
VAKREFLQLAHPFNPKKHDIAGKFMSEKLDGMRAFWDGGITRRMDVKKVPWANLEKSNQVPVSTGLWSRYGNAINAPDWWLDHLPPFPVDGELWTERGAFQSIISVVRSTVNQKDWEGVKFMVIDMPHPEKIFGPGTINLTNFKKDMTGTLTFFRKNGGVTQLSAIAPFQTRYKYLEMNLVGSTVVELLKQERLPQQPEKARYRLDKFTDELLSHGAEGVILKSPNDLWLPERTHNVIKIKPWRDAEATVIGYTTGRETDKDSKHRGRMGALKCQIPAGDFLLSGFTDAERELKWANGDSAYPWCYAHPDMDCGEGITNPMFPRGSIVTFKYRELTDSGLPKEARFWRKGS